MFEIKTTYLDNTTQIKFPCDGYHLYSNMDKLHIPDSEKPTAQLFINEINYEELKCLEDQFVDPDVLNFLAQRLDSFDKNERKKFDAVVRTFNIDNPRELVNLTFNMHYYTLIDDVSDMEKVGKTHMLTRKQSLSADNSEGYHASPYRHIVIESKNGKKRHINIPTYYDRAMQVLYAYSLNPIAEAKGERKSFAFRIGRSMQDANEYLKEAIRPQKIQKVIITDVMACYQSISHEWLLNNIPMDRRVLKEFLTAGYIFDGELFPTDDYGISLGCNISPILGNMTLDGIQKHIYEALYGYDEPDYENGNLIRFADDIIITTKDEETAVKILESLNGFLFDRGLQLSEQKTKIVNVDDGFDFLSRHYERKNGIVVVSPSDYAVTRFENELEELILNHKGSQKALIDKLNSKLTGWASYHKVSNAFMAFRRIDVFVKANLIKLCEMKHPTWSIEKIRNKYWYPDFDGQ